MSHAGMVNLFLCLSPRLRLKLLRWPGYVLTMLAMNATRASFYFWYYFPKPLAEEGLRSP